MCVWVEYQPKQAAAASSSGFRCKCACMCVGLSVSVYKLLLLELPAIIPLVLGSHPQSGQERPGRVARYSHPQKNEAQLLFPNLPTLVPFSAFATATRTDVGWFSPLGPLPDVVGIAVFCRHFFTVCSLGCSFVRCRLPVQPISFSIPTSLSARTFPITQQHDPQCCLFFFCGAAFARSFVELWVRPFLPENQNTRLGVRRTSAWNF